ncbi:MAG: hypothetical protein ACRDE6_07980 [Candidatus Limnocylindria bacterium]
MIGSPFRVSLITLVAAVLVGGCAIARVEEQDPAEIPDGPLEDMGFEATGPITELGRGRTMGIGWRYAIFESADGWCTQLDMAGLSSAGCGDLPPREGTAFGSVGSGGPSDGLSPVEGIVSSNVSEVWITASTGQRIETILMPLAEARLDGKAFLGFAPAGVTPDTVVAIGSDGQELEAFDLP